MNGFAWSKIRLPLRIPRLAEDNCRNSAWAKPLKTNSSGQEIT
jgi:hypothetical protein